MESDLYGFLEDCGRVVYDSCQKFCGRLDLNGDTKKGSLSGYDVIRLIHRRFGILVSSGTVYSLLYSLERDGLIRGVWNKRKIVYELTEKGVRNIKVITKANDEIQNFLKNISLLNPTQQSLTPT